mmetsp:Transcript_116708/g.291384  ORF Transcript_116708/g.291384 Transcript_116708/m.291384 type:complete len:91 (-) Transcript_116708:100-372(-)
MLFPSIGKLAHLAPKQWQQRASRRRTAAFELRRDIGSGITFSAAERWSAFVSGIVVDKREAGAKVSATMHVSAKHFEELPELSKEFWTES